ATGNVRFERKIDLRYGHQITELTLPAGPDMLNHGLQDALRVQFVAAHEREYGFPGRGEIILVNLRLRAVVPGEPLQLSDLAAMGERNAPAPAMTKRHLYFGPHHGMHEVQVCSRASITASRPGPLVV